MPEKVTKPTPLLWAYRCPARDCRFEDRYADVVAQHEADAHHGNLRASAGVSHNPGGAAG
ncbi:hypothetical protein [Saccharopolyspora phatthalungensis]|uniref:Uncharacterized protein n=1 Tax=Saccharopolyspora phatthalungensis TaxID=664693 RepID=A0A840QKE0_9PSEU|nr:hypothetical protein [Saccharopolyspora phatthalungensis]MBB5158823.1 hypothetical protein [Saccharopolyspora phatthalungensis]